MVKMSYDVVKRWVNEAQEAASSDNIMVQVCVTLSKTSFTFAVHVCVCTSVCASVSVYHDVPLLFTVPRPGFALSPEEERPSRCHQDAQ